MLSFLRGVKIYNDFNMQIAEIKICQTCSK